MHLIHAIAIHFIEQMTAEEAQKITENFCKDLQNTGAVVDVQPVHNALENLRGRAFAAGQLREVDKDKTATDLSRTVYDIQRAVLNKDNLTVINNIGKALATLTVLAHAHGMQIESCVDSFNNLTDNTNDASA